MAALTPGKQRASVVRGRKADLAHARCVAGLAESIERQTRHVHGLTKTARPLLTAVAMLHDVAAGHGVKRGHHLHGSRATSRLKGPPLNSWGRGIVAEAVSLHTSFLNVRTIATRDAYADCRRRVASRIAAIVRVADGLDHSRSRLTEVLTAKDDGRVLTLVVSAKTRREDILQAQAKADLWNALLARPVRIVPVRRGRVVPSGILHPGQTLAEAVAAAMHRQGEQLACRQYGLACREDLEFVHEMRVATRRMRSALRLLDTPAAKACEALAKDLKWLADLLGAVRDADVLLEFLRDCRARLGGKAQRALPRLLAWRRRRRDAAYRALVVAMRSRRCRRLLGSSSVATARQLRGGGKRAAQPVWRQGPAVLAEAWKRVRSYRGRLDKMSGKRRHQLRIDCKRLRYAAEFFAEIYQGALDELIGHMVAMQDMLGEAHDASVWRKTLNAAGKGGPALTAIDKLLRRRHGRAVVKAQRVWSALHQPRRRKKIAAAIDSCPRHGGMR